MTTEDEDKKRALEALDELGPVVRWHDPVERLEDLPEGAVEGQCSWVESENNAFVSDGAGKWVTLTNWMLRSKTNTHLDVDEALVNKPEHYGGDACMRAMESVNWGRLACLTSIERYFWRLGKKGRALQDVGKAKWYAQRLVDHDFYGGDYLTSEECKVLHRAASIGLESLSVDASTKAEIEKAMDEVFALLDRGVRSGLRLTDRELLKIAERDYKSRINDLQCELDALRYYLQHKTQAGVAAYATVFVQQELRERAEAKELLAMSGTSKEEKSQRKREAIDSVLADLKRFGPCPAKEVAERVFGSQEDKHKRRTHIILSALEDEGLAKRVPVQMWDAT